MQDVGTALGVDHVLEGSVQLDHGVLRTVVQLIRVSDGFHLFSTKLDRSLSNIFQIQDEIANEVVKHLKIHIDERERQRMLDWGTLNVDAYLLTLQGLYLTTQWNQLSLRKALEQFDAAISVDGSFVSAYVGAARAIRTIHFYVSHTEIELLRAKLVVYRSRAVQHGATPKQLHWLDYTALLLDSRGHTALEANLRGRIISGDAGPEDMLRYAVLLGGAGLFEEAYDYFARARASSELAWVELDEVPVKVAQRGLRWSIAARRDLLTRHPEQLGHLTGMAISLAKLGEFDEARTYLLRARARDSTGTFKWSFSAESALKVLSGEAPLGSDAFEQLLDDPRGSRFGRGQLCFIAGDVSRGCEYWRKLVGSGLTSATYYHLMAAHYFAPGVLDHPDYEHMLDEIGIGKNWTAFLRECVKELAPATGIELRPSLKGWRIIASPCTQLLRIRRQGPAAAVEVFSPAMSFCNASMLPLYAYIRARRAIGCPSVSPSGIVAPSFSRRLLSLA